MAAPPTACPAFPAWLLSSLVPHPGEQPQPFLLAPGHLVVPHLLHPSVAPYVPHAAALQVGTSDGRVVLIGRPGVEATLRSASRSPTQHLCFLPNRGALLRVTQDGDIQLFSAVQRRLLTSIWLQVCSAAGTCSSVFACTKGWRCSEARVPVGVCMALTACNRAAPSRQPPLLPMVQGDVINSVALLPGASDPYILLGCESGNVRVVALLDEAGQPAVDGRPAADLSLQPYQGDQGHAGAWHGWSTICGCNFREMSHQ